MEIVQERLEREFDQDLITTAPTVVYEVVLRDGTLIQVENPAKLPEVSKIEEIREPIITTTIFVPQDYVGAVITLCNAKRGNQVDMAYHGRQVQLKYDMLGTQGQSHAQLFVVACDIDFLGLRTQGEGTSRRNAEQKAAEAALQLLEGH